MNSNNMQGYRITKYNPSYFGAGGAYLKDEWTSISDIGKVFAGEILTLAEYQRVEDAYIAAVKIFLDTAGVYSLQVLSVETREDTPPRWRLEEGQHVSLQKTIEICREMLQEGPIWCRLENGENSYVHIGYDYYMYIGVSIKADLRKAVDSVKKLGLFVEENRLSPYHIS
ncbi:MAG: hypothetical protein ACR2JX_04325 [Mycobacteriales bacterium]